MVYRGLYHFSVAYDKGKATDPVKYFADTENQDLGVVKSLRSAQQKIDLSPSPGRCAPTRKSLSSNPLDKLLITLTCHE